MVQKYSILILLLFIGFSSSAQLSKIKRADRHFEDLSYKKAIELYQELALNGEPNPHISKRLADSFRLLNDWQNAEQWYFQVVNGDSPTPIDYYYLSEALRANQQYESATKWMNKYAELTDSDTRVAHDFKHRSELKGLINGSKSISIDIVGNNSDEADFGTAAYSSDKVVFASARNLGEAVEYTYAWNGRPFLDLYIADLDSNGQFYKPRIFAPELNTRYHESSVAFSKNLNVIYFTRNNYFQQKAGKSKKDVNNLKIYRAVKIGDKWGNVKSLHFNSDEYSCGHPSLSSDGDKLYFVSDMKGSKGGTDIFVCHRSGNRWGTPQNLGDSINTEGNEMFPFIHEDGTLYYSSNGFFGLGGLDIYMAAPADSLGNFHGPVNLAAPLNSSMDDFAFYINTHKTDGYISSNRQDGIGDDDIYHFHLEYKPEPYNPIAYETDELLIPQVPEDISPTSIQTRVPTSQLNSLEVGEVLVLKNIYYDLDKWFIRKDASRDLKLVIDFMLKYPKAKIELSSHTDSRAPFDYNVTLSRKRAAAAMLYIVEKGDIDPSRIVAKGYGETQLTNKCADDIECTEAQHQANRRTEVKVLEK